MLSTSTVPYVIPTLMPRPVNLVAAEELAKLEAEHRVDVQLRLFTVKGHVAHQRQHLDLLIDGNALVVLALPVEIAERDVLERPDGAQACLPLRRHCPE